MAQMTTLKRKVGRPSADEAPNLQPRATGGGPGEAPYTAVVNLEVLGCTLEWPFEHPTYWTATKQSLLAGEFGWARVTLLDAEGIVLDVVEYGPHAAI